MTLPTTPIDRPTWLARFLALSLLFLAILSLVGAILSESWMTACGGSVLLEATEPSQ
jgi:hypothetical protein